MHPVLGQCPVCQQPLEVTRLHCRSCDTTVDGHFALGRFYQLTPEQLAFAEVFIKCEGKINRVGEELGLSYPTVRGRLNDLIRGLGYEVGEEEEPPISEEERRAVLEQLAKGKISSAEAVKRLRGE